MLRVKRLSFLLLIGFLSVGELTANAQSSVLLPTQTARLFGMRRSWFTQIELDRSRGRIVGITQHVSSVRKHTILEIQYERGKIRFSERDVDAFGKMIGLPAAEKLASDKMASLETNGFKPKLEKILTPEITLYVVTDQGNLHAIDGEDGKTRWSESFGDPNHPSELAAANEEVVAFINGITLFLINQEDGKIRWQRKTVGAPIAGPAVSERFVYVPTVTGSIEFFDIEDTISRPAIYRSNGRVLTPPTLTNNNVVWQSDRGELYVCSNQKTFPKFRFETGKPIVAAPTPLPGNMLLFASVDGYLNCIHEMSQTALWRFSTGEPISTSPINVGESVFVLTDEGTLFRITMAGGEEKWQISGIRGFLAASKQRLYCISRTGRIEIVNLETGGRMGSIPASVGDLNMVNTQTDRIFFGSKTGIIQCLREETQEFPLLHFELKETETPSATPKPLGAPKPMPSSDENIDPFGAGGNKPAAPAANDDPFGNAAAKDDDPFGAAPAPKPQAKPAMDEDPFGK